MADSKLAMPRSATASPPPNCAICLGKCTNKCYSDSCMHEFCFKCLVEWSKIKAECPLCKQTFKSIIHNIKSNNEYDEHVVENIAVEDNHYLDNASLIYLPPATPPHQYHFRTTFTVDTHGEHAIQQMLLSHPLLTIGSFTPERYTHRRRRGDNSSVFRRSIYNQNLWVYAPPDITGRYREVSPSFYRNNPAARTRLVPWLNRELNALLYENTQHVMYLVDVVMDHLLRHHICSSIFRALLTDYLGSKTDHFIHEFYNFMRSPFDMIGYDRHIIYTERPPTPGPYIDVSDNDSDVIFVAPTASRPESRRTEPVIIDLLDTDSDEPIIVSEEINGNNSSQINEEAVNNRKTILPIKLRIKNKHKSKERRKKRRRTRLLTSSSSSTSNSTLSSSSSTESDDNVYEVCKPKKLHSKSMKSKKSKRRDFTHLERDLNSSDNEDEIPLSNLASRKKKSKHLEKKHKSHTATSREAKIRFRPRHSLESPTRDLCPNPEDCEPISNIYNLPLETSHFQSSSCRFPDSHVKTEGVVKNEVVENNFWSESDTSDSNYSRPNVKSRISEVRAEDKPKAGPSTSRLRNILRKEESSNLWYSRPLPYDSDSSDD